MPGSHKVVLGGAKRGAPPAAANDGFAVPTPKKRKRVVAQKSTPMPDLPDPMNMLDDDQKITDAGQSDSSRQGRSRRRDSVPATPVAGKQGQRRRHSAAPRTIRKKVRDCDLAEEMKDVNMRIKNIYDKQSDVFELNRKLRNAIQANKFEENLFVSARKRFEEECDLLKQRAGGTKETKQLRSKLEILEEQFNAQASSLQDAQSYREVTEKENADLRKQNFALRDQVARGMLTSQQLEMKLNRAKGTNTALKNATQKLNEDRDKRKTDVAEATTKAQLLQDQLSLFKTMHQAVQRELTALKEHEQRRLQGEENASFDKQADLMAQKVREIQEQCNKQVDIANAQAQQKVQTELSKLDTQVKDVRAQLATAQTQAANAKARATQALQEQASAERQMALLKKQKGDLEAEMTKYVVREREFMNEVNMKNTKISELRTEVTTVVNERDALQARGRLFGDDEVEFEKLLSNMQRYVDMEESREARRQNSFAKLLSKQQAEAAKQHEVAGHEAAEARAQYEKFVGKADQGQGAKKGPRVALRQHAQHQPAAPMAIPGTSKAEKPKSDKIDVAETRSKAKQSRQEESLSARAGVQAA